jgi:hypothetical protein
VIDIASESVLSLTQAASLFPPGRNGARPTIGCFTRWILKGVKGPNGQLVRLEALRLGSKWVTSRETIQRFAERLTPQLDNEPGAAPRTANQRGHQCPLARAWNLCDRVRLTARLSSVWWPPVAGKPRP